MMTPSEHESINHFRCNTKLVNNSIHPVFAKYSLQRPSSHDGHQRSRVPLSHEKNTSVKTVYQNCAAKTELRNHRDHVSIHQTRDQNTRTAPIVTNQRGDPRRVAPVQTAAAAPRSAAASQPLFHNFIREFSPVYRACRSKQEQARVIDRVVQLTRTMGSLVVFREGSFVEIPIHKARRCVQRALEAEKEIWRAMDASPVVLASSQPVWNKVLKVPLDAQASIVHERLSTLLEQVHPYSAELPHSCEKLASTNLSATVSLSSSNCSDAVEATNTPRSSKPKPSSALLDLLSDVAISVL